MNAQPSPIHRAPIAAQSTPDLPDVVDVATLLRNRQVLVIEHAGEHYKLRLTRNGKLILTK